MVTIEMSVALLAHTITIITNLLYLHNIIKIEVVIVNKLNRLILQCGD